MATATATPSVLDQKLSRRPGKIGMIIFGVVLAVGVGYAGHSLLHDLSFVHNESILPFVLLGVALLVALGFEFVNGFHDTANAVATVIYTHSLEPHIAVVWSGFWNFLGVLASSGLVAFAIVSLLAGRTDSASRQQSRIRHGLRSPRRRHHLEPRHLVVRTPCLEFPHPHRLRHRRRHRQPAHERQKRHQRRRLGTGCQHRQGSAPLARRRLRLRRASASPRQSAHQRSQTLHSSRRHRAASLLHPLPARPHLHRRQLFPRLQRRAKRHGPHHADSHRHRPHRLRPQPRHHLSGFQDFVAVSQQAAGVSPTT
jgi:hypothetical protein